MAGDEDTDFQMLRGGVSVDEEGDFDPTSLLSQPINFNESIDELDINIEEGGDFGSVANGGDGGSLDDSRKNDFYYEHESKNDREGDYYRSQTPDPQAMMNHHRQEQNDRYNDHGPHEGAGGMQRGRRSPRDYDHPPYDRRTPPRGRPRQGGRNSERIAEVQQKIRQVQQQIHENMDDDQSNGMDISPNRQHSPYPQEPGYQRHHRDQEMYSDNYGDGSYHSGGPRDRYPPPHHGPRPYGDGNYRGNSPHHHRRQSHQQPLQHRGPHMMHDPRGPENDNGYGRHDRRHTIHDMRRGGQPNQGMPGHHHNHGPGGYYDGPGGMQQQHVLGGMSQSLNGMADQQPNNNPMMQQQQHQPQHMRHMSQSYNDGMQNGPRRGIQSMSDSLNGVNNQPRMDQSSNNGMNRGNGMNRSRNGMNHSNRGIQSMSASLNGMQNMNNSNNMLPPQPQHQQRGIQSMSASLNGLQQANGEQNMSQSMNGMQGGYAGQQQGQMPMNRSQNGMQHMPQNQNRVPFMSASQNGMPNMNSSNQGGHPLQGMSQSLNGAPNTGYGESHQSMPHQMNNMPGDPGMQMSNNGMNMMNRSNNMGNSMNGNMNASVNGNMNASSNGGPPLNNSNVPSAPLLNQVSNLADLPNRRGSPNSPEGDPENIKMSRKLMEAMKRTASSRKLIRELNIAAMLRGDLKSPSSSAKKSVVKAKRKAGRMSYTKSQSEAAASREHSRHIKSQQAIESV